MVVPDSGETSYDSVGEDDEAIRLYRDGDMGWDLPDELAGWGSDDELMEEDWDTAARPPAHNPVPVGVPSLKRESDGKGYNGNVYGSDNESLGLAVETAQKRYDRIEGDRREALNQRVKDENELRNKLGNALLWLVGMQLIVSDIFLSVFMCRNVHDQTVMLAWLSASVVEIIGIIWVITRSIFPFQDGYRDMEAENMARPGRMSQISELKTSQTVEAP